MRTIWELLRIGEFLMPRHTLCSHFGSIGTQLPLLVSDTSSQPKTTSGSETWNSVSRSPPTPQFQRWNKRTPAPRHFQDKITQLIFHVRAQRWFWGVPGGVRRKRCCFLFTAQACNLNGFSSCEILSVYCLSCPPFVFSCHFMRNFYVVSPRAHGCGVIFPLIFRSSLLPPPWKNLEFLERGLCSGMGNVLWHNTH